VASGELYSGVLISGMGLRMFHYACVLKGRDLARMFLGVGRIGLTDGAPMVEGGERVQVCSSSA